MGRLVMKFGGTSVANIDRIRNVARHVKREVDAGHDVAVVVSAMAGKTNELVEWCREASAMHDAREYDAVVALVALYWTARAWFHRWTTETDVTNMRVVHKSGFIKRRTFEMALDKIESVDVNQSIMGRILNYGDVTIMGVGEGRETIRTIAAPLQFRNNITAR